LYLADLAIKKAAGVTTSVDTVSVNARYFRPYWKGIDVPSFKVMLKRYSVSAFDSVGFFFPVP